MAQATEPRVACHVSFHRTGAVDPPERRVGWVSRTHSVSDVEPLSDCRDSGGFVSPSGEEAGGFGLGMLGSS